MSERDDTIRMLWCEVNRLACITEDKATIRGLIAEAGIRPGVHVGTKPEDFTPTMVGEWCLGQWADMIDRDSPFLNSGRNVSMANYEKLHGYPDWWLEHLAEVQA